MQLKREGAFRVVCNIRTPLIDSENAEKVGTGIFISKDLRAILVTAAHIANETNDRTYIVFCDSENNSSKKELKSLNESVVWHYHPTADICYMELDVSKNMDLLSNRCLPFENIDLSGKLPSRDTELTCVGFPKGLGANGAKYSPFTFRSFVSSGLVSLIREDTKTESEFFCLENPSVGGYSGGPVFDMGYQSIGTLIANHGDTKLYGIMHGTISDVTGGKIAAVTPIYFLKDIL